MAALSRATGIRARQLVELVDVGVEDLSLDEAQVQRCFDTDGHHTGVEPGGGVGQQPPGAVVGHDVTDECGDPGEQLERWQGASAEPHHGVVCPGALGLRGGAHRPSLPQTTDPVAISPGEGMDCGWSPHPRCSPGAGGPGPRGGNHGCGRHRHRCRTGRPVCCRCARAARAPGDRARAGGPCGGAVAGTPRRAAPEQRPGRVCAAGAALPALGGHLPPT